MSSFLVCACIVLGVILNTLTLTRSTTADVNTLKPGVVQISSSSQQGTGFIVAITSDRRFAYIVTAAHVVGADDKLDVIFYNGPRSVSASLLFKEDRVKDRTDRGLALLLVDQDIPAGAQALPLYTTRSPATGDSVFILGSSGIGAAWSVIPGKVIGLDGPDILFSGNNISGGISGGPMTKDSKTIIGLVTATGPDNVAIPATQIRDFLRGVPGSRIPFTDGLPPSPNRTKCIAEDTAGCFSYVKELEAECPEKAGTQYESCKRKIDCWSQRALKLLRADDVCDEDKPGFDQVACIGLKREAAQLSPKYCDPQESDALVSASRDSLFGQQDLRYQSRTDRWEGVKTQPVSNDPIELISAIVRNNTESQNEMPDVLKIKFYLNERSEAFLTVREIDNKFFYWMDRVQPDRWQKGFNDFEWSTSEVLKKVGIQDLRSLGVVIRMNTDRQNVAQEEIAPAIFYHTNRPSKIKEYLFTFKTNDLSDLTCDVYPDNSDGSLARENFPSIHGGRPVTFVFDSSGRADGWYRLVVNQILRRTNQKYQKVIRFYHQYGDEGQSQPASSKPTTISRSSRESAGPVGARSEIRTLEEFDKLTIREKENVLSQDGPLLPSSYNMEDIQMRVFVRGGWPLAISYSLSPGATARLTVTIDATDSLIQQLDTGENKEVVIPIPDTFGEAPRVAKLHIRTTVRARNSTSAPFMLHSIGIALEENEGNAGPLAALQSNWPVSKLPSDALMNRFVLNTWSQNRTSAISNVILQPAAIRTSQRENLTFSFVAKSFYRGGAAEFFLYELNPQGELIPELVFRQGLKPLRQGEGVSGRWDGRKSSGEFSYGVHRLGIRMWRELAAGAKWHSLICDPQVTVSR